jgi:hypothetical protein
MECLKAGIFYAIKLIFIDFNYNSQITINQIMFLLIVISSLSFHLNGQDSEPQKYLSFN